MSTMQVPMAAYVMVSHGLAETVASDWTRVSVTHVNMAVSVWSVQEWLDSRVTAAGQGTVASCVNRGRTHVWPALTAVRTQPLV